MNLVEAKQKLEEAEAVLANQPIAVFADQILSFMLIADFDLKFSTAKNIN